MSKVGVPKPGQGPGSRWDPREADCNFIPAAGLRKMVEARRYHAAVGSQPRWESLAREVSAAVMMDGSVPEFRASPLADGPGMEFVWPERRTGEFVRAVVQDLRQVDEAMLLVREVMES